ncbi:MAG: hypothetical protein WC858_00500 [Parcubacteria group bacterium]|jgi:hypothetical protein
MDRFQFFASPWWVNLFALIPFISFYLWRGKLSIPRAVLVYTAIFGIAFGYIEAAVVMYLRGAIGLANSTDGIALIFTYQQADILAKLPFNFLSAEMYREAATLILILLIAVVAVKQKYNRWAIFFWVFSFWDIFYYVWLKALIGWPQSFTTPDVLFLIPVPWQAQIWWPISISLLLICVVAVGKSGQWYSPSRGNLL